MSEVSPMHSWLLASRPATLTAAVAPVLAGTAVSHARGDLHWGGLVATFLGASLLQIASNFANDVFDYEKGADTEERLGPTRAVQAGLVTPQAMKRGLALVIVLALFVGVYLTTVAGPVIVAIGVASILSAIAYTGGPYPLGYHGLGDVFVMLFFGLVAVCGTTFVHLGQVPLLALPPAIAIGAVTTNILVVNNLRDRHTDRKAGKRTLAVRLGRRGAELEYLVLYALAYAAPLLMWGLSWTGPGPLACYLTLPLALGNFRGIRTHEGRELNLYLVRSAKLVFLYGLTFSVGLIAESYL